MRALARVPRDRHPSMSRSRRQVLACLSRTAAPATPTPAPPWRTRRMPPTSTARVSPRARIARGAVACGAGGRSALAACRAVPVCRPRTAGALEQRSGRGARARAAGAAAHCGAEAAPRARAAAAWPRGGSRAGGAAPWPEPSRWPAGGPPPRTPRSKRVAARAAPCRRRGRRYARRRSRRLGEPAERAHRRRRSPRGRDAARQPPAAAIVRRGQAAFDRGDYPEAVRRGREAIAAGAALGGRLLIGDAYYRLERFADALREYQAALALDPAEHVDPATARSGREQVAAQRTRRRLAARLRCRPRPAERGEGWERGRQRTRYLM